MTVAHIFYSGIVQGVGFRYTVRHGAHKLGLVGWVKNLDDGRVEMWVEGKKEIIEELMQNIESRFDSNYIRDKQLFYEPASRGYRDFTIAF